MIFEDMADEKTNRGQPRLQYISQISEDQRCIMSFIPKLEEKVQ